MKLVAAIILISLTCFAQSNPGAKPKALPPVEFPNEFVVARHFFFDFGPPNDFYEIFAVHPADNGTVVEKISLTPSADKCLQRPTVDFASATLADNIATLLRNKNPCSISERQLRQERDRRKKGLVFSGADVSVQMACGDNNRIIRADILDRDMFDPATKTPENTSWSMQVLSRLDAAAGPNAADKPMFSVAKEHPMPSLPDQIRQRLVSGDYDQLFSGAPDKPSLLYQAAQVVPAKSAITLHSSVPIAPESPILPVYPPIARLAHVEGAVVVTATVDASGNVASVDAVSGHPMLREAAKQAVSAWKFPKRYASQQIKAEFEFSLNCVSAANSSGANTQGH